MSDIARYSRTGAVAELVLDHRPVNALSGALRAAILDGVAAFEADADARILVLRGRQGAGFSAGADVREFGLPPVAPRLPDLIERIEQCRKPVIAVLHGAALGGGLELALGAHGRVALADARIGLPEVTLGLVPGAGGAQRMMRLCGVEATLDLVTSGRSLDAQGALAAGLAEAVAQGHDPALAGRDHAARVLAGEVVLRRAASLAVPAHDPAVFDTWRARLARTRRGEQAPQAAVTMTAESAAMPLAEGVAHGRACFQRLMQSPQRKALVHAFAAERAAPKLARLAGVAPRPLDCVGVVGGGTMGAGIAMALLLAGLPVILSEREADAAAQARARVRSHLQGAIRRGKIATDDPDAWLDARLHTCVGLDALSGADLIIEAAFEDMAVKAAIFAELDRVARPGAVLATNTSYLDIDALAAPLSRPEAVLGLHFFTPAHVMRLLEVVEGARTAPEVLATGFALARRLGKIAVRAGVCDGFIGNRILSQYRAVADHMVLDGTDPDAIDAAVRDFGFPMGPFELSDLSGLDIGAARRRRLAPFRDPRDRVPHHADALCAAGALGRKAGRGFYLYDADGRRIGPNPDLAPILDRVRAAHGRDRPLTDPAEIQTRYLAAMINAAADVLHDGIASRALDIDVVFLHGYGFPRWRGGPLYFADIAGPAHWRDQIQRLSAEDPHFWRLSPLLARLADEGRPFSSFDTSSEAR